MNYNGELLYRKKFKRIGRTFTLGWRNGYNESDAENYSLAPYNFYKPDGSLYTSPDQNLKAMQDRQL